MNFYYKPRVLKSGRTEEEDDIGGLVSQRMFKSQLCNVTTKKKKSNFWICRVTSPEAMGK